MSRWHGSVLIRIIVFLSLTGFLLSSLQGQETDTIREQAGDVRSSDRSEEGQAEAASTVLQRFQRSWDRDDLDSLMGLLSDRSRVIMNVDLLGFKGEYGRGQAKYIMKEFFARAETKQFYFSRYRELSGGQSAYAAGEISYRDRKTGIELELMIFLSLEERDGGWSVEEIRINDR